MANNLNCGRKFTIVSWIHSHVQGMKCCFSSIDIHTQYALQQIYPNCFGIVVEIKRDSLAGQYDAYKVTDDGATHVWLCNDRHKRRSMARVQHESCGSQALYKSIMSGLSFNTSTLETLNFMTNPTSTGAHAGTDPGKFKNKIELHLITRWQYEFTNICQIIVNSCV